jgi:hypothetical protein
MGDVIKEGYKMTITDEEGTVLDDIQLGGYNIEKPIARASLMSDIQSALPAEAFDPPGEAGQPVTVECPICHEMVEVPHYDKVSRSNALTKHIEKEHTGYMARPTGGNPMTESEINEIANKVAAKVLEEISPSVLDPGGRGLLLHFTEHAIEGGGRVVNEARAKTSPCNCFTYNGREYCFSPGVIGMMSSKKNPEQIDEYCKAGKTYEVKPGIKKRFESFAEAAEEAQEKIEEIPRGERLGPWLSEMSTELEKRGIEL